MLSSVRPFNMNIPVLTMNTGDPVTLDELEKEHVLKVLQSAPNQAAAARTLGVNRKTVYSKVRRWGLSQRWFVGEPPAPPTT